MDRVLNLKGVIAREKILDFLTSIHISATNFSTSLQMTSMKRVNADNAYVLANSSMTTIVGLMLLFI